MTATKRPTSRLRAAARTGRGHRVEQADGVVISNPGGDGEQPAALATVESPAVEPTAGIKASDAPVVPATGDLGRWPFLMSADESLLPERNRPLHVVIPDRDAGLRERVRATWPLVITAPNQFGRFAFGAGSTGTVLLGLRAAALGARTLSIGERRFRCRHEGEPR
jgi:hypothetical protein